MLRQLTLVATLCILVGLGTVAYLYLKPPAAASQPITAIPIELPTNEAPAASDDAPTTGSAQTETATETSSGSESAPVAEAGAAVEEAASTEAARPLIFEIVPEESEARFIINEVLNGAPKTVVGVTNQVAGQIAVDLETPANTRIGVIQVNARTLATDNGMRNRTISNRILMTNDYEYITFAPTAIEGLPEAVDDAGAAGMVGETMQLQITGDLTVRDVTRQVTFTAQVTPVSETRLEGTASTVIRYADFGITIPQVPSVTGVDEEVTLEIDFVAEAV